MEPVTSKELLPCPFCGDTNRLEIGSLGVQCMNCSAVGPGFHKHTAVESWNKRAAHEPRAGRLTKCPFCNSPSRPDGSIQHSAGCEGLGDSGLNKLQVFTLENALSVAIDRACLPPRVAVRLDQAGEGSPEVNKEPSGEQCECTTPKRSTKGDWCTTCFGTVPTK